MPDALYFSKDRLGKRHRRCFRQGLVRKAAARQTHHVGYTTRNSGGVPDNFKNYFVIVFDRDFAAARLADGKKLLAADKQELQANHAGANRYFQLQTRRTGACPRGLVVYQRGASHAKP